MAAVFDFLKLFPALHFNLLLL